MRPYGPALLGGEVDHERSLNKPLLTVQCFASETSEATERKPRLTRKSTSRRPRSDLEILPPSLIHALEVHCLAAVMHPPLTQYLTLSYYTARQETHTARQETHTSTFVTQTSSNTHVASGSYSAQIFLNSSRCWGPRIDQSRVK